MEPEKTPRERAEDLIRLLVPDWRPTPQQRLWAIRIGIVLGLLVAIGYFYGITLWDWAKLLIVPAVIAAGGLWFNAQQRDRERRIAERRAQDDTLQAYLDGISQLLTDKELPLHGAQPGDSLSTVARARTLTVLGRLDSGRKRSVLQFLYESRLIDQEQALLDESDLIERQHNIVSLRGSDLREADLRSAVLIRADLSGANLSGADLIGAYLSETRLSGANLSDSYLIRAFLIGANLFGANLREADLFGARLMGAVLFGARLMGADLSHAVLSGANLRQANLSEANLSEAVGLTDEQIAAAYSLEGATMPDGQNYEDWHKDKENHGEDGENGGRS